MTSAEADDQALIDALTAIIEDLCMEWLAFISDYQGELTHLRHSRSDGAAPAVHALAMHATHHARAVVTLMREGHPSIVIMPLIRQVFEAGVTAQWLAQVEDAAWRWGFAGVNRTTKLAWRMRASSSAQMVEIGEFLEAKFGKQKEHYPKPQGRAPGSFLSILEDLVLDSNELYIQYSAVSEYTHASVRAVEAYAIGHQEGGGIILRPTPNAPSPDVWLKLAASGLVWAHTAANYTDRERSQRNHLRTAARQIGISPNLHPSQQANARNARRRPQTASRRSPS